jgi:hypothetical protein
MWAEQVLNPKVISSIFKNDVPSLKEIKMQEIALLFSGDLLCRMSFDLKEFPSEAPLKWVQSKYNRVQISLALIEANVNHFSVGGGMLVGDLSIVLKDSEFEIEFKTDNGYLVFQASAKWIHVDKVSGYISD